MSPSFGLVDGNSGNCLSLTVEQRFHGDEGFVTGSSRTSIGIARRALSEVSAPGPSLLFACIVR